MSADSEISIVMYALTGCPHCHRALSLLRRRGVSPVVVCGDGDPGFRRRIADLAGGATVPQIVIDGRPIGGADRLAHLDRVGVLAALISGQRLPVIRTRRRWWHPGRSRCVAEAFDATGRRVGRGAGRDEAAALGALGMDHD